MSSGWHSTLTISHPDEILPIAMSFGWLTAQAVSLLHIMHMILGLAGGNIVNFTKYSSLSTPISFEQLPVKSVTKRCSICRYFRFTDIEWASKKRFQSSSEAMGIPIQAWMTKNIALFYATWLLIHVQISMMVSSISFSNSGPSSGVLIAKTCRDVAKW